ncbi:MAG TPA: phage major capsid protein [Spirochaetia bacterium]|nr:phage major capsid protein [Spirochaetia bacterium]
MDKRLKTLYDKRAWFVQQQKDLLDKVLNEKRDLNDTERVEQQRLSGEVRKMDEIIAIAKTTLDGGGSGYCGISDPLDGLGYGPQQGENRGFLRNNYRAEFRGIADFAAACRWSELRENREMVMGIGASGGFLVPNVFIDQIFQVTPESSIVRPRARVFSDIERPDSAVEIPTLDQSGGKGEMGGLTVQWIAEASPKPETDVELKQVKLEPNEVAAHIVVTDKLLRNAGAAEMFLSTVMRSALFAAEDQAFLTGTGIGQPLGIIGHPATIQVARAGPGGIAFADFANMLAALHPDSLSKAIWLISQSALAQVVTLVDAANNLIFVGRDASKGLPATILGIPVRFTGRLPILGAPGDVVLADFSGYVIRQGSGPYIKASDAIYFRSNKTVIKCFYSVDAQPFITTPIMLSDGLTPVSFFVQLQ